MYEPEQMLWVLCVIVFMLGWQSKLVNCELNTLTYVLSLLRMLSSLKLVVKLINYVCFSIPGRNVEAQRMSALLKVATKYV